jgi:hypothetical protein
MMPPDNHHVDRQGVLPLHLCLPKAFALLRSPPLSAQGLCITTVSTLGVENGLDLTVKCQSDNMNLELFVSSSIARTHETGW